MGFANNAARAAAFLWARRNAVQRKSGRTWSCCGLPVEVDHRKRGCDGEVHPSMGGSNHSGELMVSEAEYRRQMGANNIRSARKVEGGYLIIRKRKL